MDKKMKNIKNDIMGGNDLEVSIPQFFNEMTSNYSSYAGIRLAMHYFAFYEAYCDNETSSSEASNELIEQINVLMKENVIQNQNGDRMEAAIQAVDQIRNEIMKRMKVLTAYTDIFQIYEYLLNRIEYQFKEEIIQVNDDDFAKEILSYIFDTQDNLIINEKIKEIIGQLPVRLTKTKYYELLSGSILAYQGSYQSALDTYLYLLRTGAMLYHPDGMEEYYPELLKKKENLAQLTYKNLSQLEYQNASNLLQEAIEYLERETSTYYSLQEITNEVYAILLCAPYKGFGATNWQEQEKAVSQIISVVNKEFRKKSNKNLSTKVIDQFVQIEGVQEVLSFEVANLEGVLYEVDMNHRRLTQSLMIDKILNGLLRTQDLLSNSIFIDFNEAKSEQTVNEVDIELEKNKLLEELKKLFESQDRAIGKAVMANTLNRMPVFFQNHKEVMDYIRYSISGCTYPEKAACVEIIRKIMSE